MIAPLWYTQKIHPRFVRLNSGCMTLIIIPVTQIIKYYSYKMSIFVRWFYRQFVIHIVAYNRAMAVLPIRYFSTVPWLRRCSGISITCALRSRFVPISVRQAKWIFLPARVASPCTLVASSDRVETNVSVTLEYTESPRVVSRQPASLVRRCRWQKRTKPEINRCGVITP